MIAVCMGAQLSLAQQTPKQSNVEPSKPKPKRKIPAAFEPPEVNESLPNVLLLGDSISIGYMLDVRKQLSGQANVWRPAVNCGPTTRGLESLDKWIGDRKWDLIHFNFGLPGSADRRMTDRTPTRATI